MPITQMICQQKNYIVCETKTDIKDNLLDDSINVNTIEKLVKFEIRKEFFFRGWHFCHSFGTLRVNVYFKLDLSIPGVVTPLN